MSQMEEIVHPGMDESSKTISNLMRQLITEQKRVKLLEAEVEALKQTLATERERRC